MISGSLIAMSFYPPWDRLSRLSDWIVVVFGMLIWACCVFSPLWLGMRAMSTERYKGARRKRARPAKERA